MGWGKFIFADIKHTNSAMQLLCVHLISQTKNIPQVNKSVISCPPNTSNAMTTVPSCLPWSLKFRLDPSERSAATIWKWRVSPPYFERQYISLFIYFTSTGSSIFLKFLRPAKHLYLKTSAQVISFSKILPVVTTICVVCYHKHTNRYGSQGLIMAEMLFVHIYSLDRSLSDMQKHTRAHSLSQTQTWLFRPYIRHAWGKTL